MLNLDQNLKKIMKCFLHQGYKVATQKVINSLIKLYRKVLGVKSLAKILF